MKSRINIFPSKWCIASLLPKKQKKHAFFFLKKHAYSSAIPPVQCWESVKIVWNFYDGCLVYLADLKLKKSTLKLREGGLCHNFCGWLSKIILTGIYLSRCLQTFSNKFTNKLHILHTASTGSLILKGVLSFDLIF